MFTVGHKVPGVILCLQGGDDLDPNYVLSSRVRTGRSIKGFSLPPHNSRGERRAIEKLSIEGQYLRVSDVTHFFDVDVECFDRETHSSPV